MVILIGHLLISSGRSSTVSFVLFPFLDIQGEFSFQVSEANRGSYREQLPLLGLIYSNLSIITSVCSSLGAAPSALEDRGTCESKSETAASSLVILSR